MSQVHAEINVLPVYKPLLQNRDRLLFLYGGRNSGKSIFAAQKFIVRTLNDTYFRGVLVRKTYESIKDSQFQTIKDLVFDYGLENFFTFTENPLSIKCKLNKNMIIARGCDKPERLKSLKDPSCIWYEEGNQLDEKDFIIASTSVRGQKSEYLQEIFSFNPESEVNYEDFWLYRMFFAGHTEKSFQGKIEMELPDGSITNFKYTAKHTTYNDNPYVTAQQIADLEQYKKINPYYYTIYALGHWGNRDVDGRFLKSFSYLKHVREVEVNHNFPLHISFDENVNPFPALAVWQIVGQELRQVHEICLRTPRNKLTEVAKEFRKWARKIGFNDIVYIYGDASSAKDDTKMEKGHNYFTLLEKEIAEEFICHIRKPRKNPPVALSADYINTVFELEYEGWSIKIDPSCKESVSDYNLAQEKSDGTMLKKKINGVEVVGHFVDTLRYFVMEATKDSYNRYKSRAKKKNNHKWMRTKSRSY